MMIFSSLQAPVFIQCLDYGYRYGYDLKN